VPIDLGCPGLGFQNLHEADVVLDNVTQLGNIPAGVLAVLHNGIQEGNVLLPDDILDLWQEGVAEILERFVVSPDRAFGTFRNGRLVYFRAAFFRWRT
jgi:hypothetical protein